MRTSVARADAFAWLRPVTVIIAAPESGRSVFMFIIQSLRLAVFLLSFLGMLLFLHARTNYKWTALPFLVVNVMIVLLYGASTLGLLLPAGILVWSSGIVLGVLSLPAHCRQRKAGEGALKLPVSGKLAGILVLFLLLWLISRGLTCWRFDEFSAWAYAVKDMCHTNALPRKGGPVWLPLFPPAVTLFRYYVCLVLGFSEPNMYFAHLLMLVSGLLLFLENVKWRKSLVLAVMPFLVYFFLFISRNSFLHTPFMMHISALAGGAFAVYCVMKGYCDLRSAMNLVLLVFMAYNLHHLLFGRTSLYMDSLLSLYFGCILAFFILSHVPLRGRLLYIMPGLAVLTLTKNIGYPFATIVSAVIVADAVVLYLFEYGETNMRTLTSNAWRGLKNHRTCCVLLLVTIAVPHLSYGSWSLFTRYADYGDVLYSDGVAPKKVMRACLSRGESLSPKQKLILERYKLALFEKDIHNVQFVRLGRLSVLLDNILIGMNGLLLSVQGTEARLSAWVWSILLVALGIGVSLLQTSAVSMTEGLVSNLLCAFGFLCYALLFLVFYLFLFPAGMALHLTGFERFLGTFVGGWLLVIVAWGVRGLYSSRCRISAIFLILLTVGSFFATSGAAFDLQTLVRPHAERANIRHKALYLKESRAREVSKVFFLWQKKPGLQEFYMAHYELHPHRHPESEFFRVATGRGVNDVDAKYGDGTPLTRVLGVAEFAEILSEFDYLLIGHADDGFWNDYGSLFPDGTSDGSKFLFRIGPKSDSVILTPL